MKNTIEFIRENYQDRANDLEDKFSSTGLTLNELIRDLMSDSKALQKERDYKKAITTLEALEDINEISRSMQAITEELNMKTTKKLKANNKQGKRGKKNQTKRKANYDKQGLPDYDKYLVNTETPHSLKEDFRFKRPYAFQMGDYSVKVSTWREMLVSTCKYLYKLNPEKFKSFANDESMQWGSTFNFSTDESLLRGPAPIKESGVFVETNKDSIAVRQLIIKMLERYELDISEFTVYLRADYTDRRKK